MTQATFYRAMRRLLNCGFLERADGSRAKTYTVRSDRIDPELTSR